MSEPKPDKVKDTIREWRTNLPKYAQALLKVRRKDGSLKPFLFNRAQRHIDGIVNEQMGTKGMVRLIVLKGRSMGATTYFAGRNFWKTHLRSGRRTLILTHQDAASDTVFGMVKRFNDNLPPELRPSMGADAAKVIRYDKLGSEIGVTTAGSRGAGRSGVYQSLHWTEVAHSPNAEEHVAGLGPAVPAVPGSEMVLESTANGIANKFHELWRGAVEGANDFHPVFCPWFWAEEYARPVPEGFRLTDEEDAYRTIHGLTLEQMSWRRAKIDTDFGGKPLYFAQEYPATAAEAFVAVGHDAFIGSIEVAAAQASGKGYVSQAGPLIVGVDPARFGDDSTAIVRRRGRWVDEVERASKKDTMHVAGRIIIIIREERPARIFIDEGGLGAGIIDRLRELGYGDVVTAVNFGSTADRHEKYVNKRAEMWGEMRDWLRAVPVRLPSDQGLIGDLSGPGYGYDSNGRTKLESKDDMRKRGVESPDAGDALALTFAMPVAMVVEGARRPNIEDVMEEEEAGRGMPGVYLG